MGAASGAGPLTDGGGIGQGGMANGRSHDGGRPQRSGGGVPEVGGPCGLGLAHRVDALTKGMHILEGRWWRDGCGKGMEGGKGGWGEDSLLWR